MKKINTLKSLHFTRYNRNPLTVLRSYGLTVFFLSAFCLLPSMAQAKKYYYEIKQEYSVLQIHDDLLNIIDKAEKGDTVMVTGSKTDVDKELYISVSQDKIVIWQADYQYKSQYDPPYLIEVSGGFDAIFEINDATLINEYGNVLNVYGETFNVIVSGNSKLQTSGDGAHAITTKSYYGYVEIKDNAYLSSTTGETIESNGDFDIVNVTGGTVCATSENAIITNGKNAKINISGGHVYNDAKGLYNAVYAVDKENGNETLIHVSGNAIVEAKGMGAAVSSYVGVKVSGNATVRNNLGGDLYAGAVVGIENVTVTENAKIIAQNNCAIYGCENVTVSGNSIVEAKNYAIGIYIYGNQGPTMGYVTVSDNAQVIAAHNYAISSHNTVLIDNGVVFAYGNEMSHVINNEYFSSTTGLGIVLAWNKESGNTNYDRFSRDDIFILPESATAYWDSKAGKQGIYYENGENSGFIPLEVNVLSINEPNLPSIEVYPNPTTGVLNLVEIAGQARNDVQKVEVFDVYGRKLLEPPLTVLRSYDLTILPTGIYFVRITTEEGVVTKKVIKL